MMINRKKKVSTISATKQDTREYPPGECAAYPFDAKPPVKLKPAFPLAITYSTPAPAIPPITCAITYGNNSAAGNLFPATRPTDTAGMRWQPEMCPMAKPIVRRVRPNAKATP